jgi:hypothetical protein
VKTTEELVYMLQYATSYLQNASIKNMVLDASRNVVTVKIMTPVTSTLENVHWDVNQDTTLRSANKVSAAYIVSCV